MLKSVLLTSIEINGMELLLEKEPLELYKSGLSSNLAKYKDSEIVIIGTVKLIKQFLCDKEFINGKSSSKNLPFCWNPPIQEIECSFLLTREDMGSHPFLYSIKLQKNDHTYLVIGEIFKDTQNNTTIFETQNGRITSCTSSELLNIVEASLKETSFCSWIVKKYDENKKTINQDFKSIINSFSQNCTMKLSRLPDLFEFAIDKTI